MPGSDGVLLRLPFAGTWRAVNSPARRVPSHGSHLFATTFAIDFVAVAGQETARTRDWRTVLATEPPERFVAFGQPVLSPAAGRVVTVHDGEPDSAARRSAPARMSYALTQASRARGGAGALAGNHVVLAAGDGAFVVLAHLRRGSIRVAVGQHLEPGEQVAECGNSGNSTQPHVHLQAMDDADPFRARGLPMLFADLRVWPADGGPPVDLARGVPGEQDVVEPR
ncbi:M23 family metallopeptidase [Modestobacter sp. SYSU DS0290]